MLIPISELKPIELHKGNCYICGADDFLCEQYHLMDGKSLYQTLYVTQNPDMLDLNCTVSLCPTCTDGMKILSSDNEDEVDEFIDSLDYYQLKQYMPLLTLTATLFVISSGEIGNHVKKMENEELRKGD